MSGCGCYVIDASGSFSIIQNNPGYTIQTTNPLALHDISNSIQILMSTRTFNTLIGISKNESNESLVNVDYDTSTNKLKTDTLTFDTEKFKANVSSNNITSLGAMSTLYSDFNYTVQKFFGSTVSFPLIAESPSYNLNNGVFDVSGLIQIINGQSYKVDGAVVSDLSGSFTINNINSILTYINDSNIFNNRPPTKNLDISHGFIENDLIFVKEGLSITMTLDINITQAGTNAPVFSNGPNNLQKIDASINYFDASSNIRKVTTYSLTNITQTYTVPLLIILKNIETFNYDNFGQEWIDITSATLGPKDWLACSISTNGQYQSVIDLSGDIYVSSNYGTDWSLQKNIGRSPANQIAISTSGQYQTACSGSEIYVSNNYGSTWTLVFAVGQSEIFVSISLNGQYQTLISAGDAMYRSTNYGMTWTRYEDDTNDLYYSIQGFPTGGVAMSYNGQYQAIVSEAIHLSNDYGATWTTTSVDTTNVDFDDHNWMDVTMSSTGQYQAAVEVTGEIYVSDNYGVTWSKRDEEHIRDRQWQGISMSASGKFITALAKGGNVFVSIDFGDTWAISSDTKLRNKQWQDIAVSANAIYQNAVVYGGAVFISTLVT